MSHYYEHYEHYEPYEPYRRQDPYYPQNGYVWSLIKDQQEWIRIKLSEEVTSALNESLLAGHGTVGSSQATNETDIVSEDPTLVLARSNYRPSSEQCHILNAIKEQKLVEAAAIEGEIKDLLLKVKETMQPSLGSLLERLRDLRKMMKALQQSRLQKRIEAKAYDFMMSPIRLLPPEILSMVFVIAISFPEPKDRVSILDLSQVCSAWRYAALCSSSLWNHMDYLFGFHGDEDALLSDHYKTYFAMWFGRANISRPLTLTLTISRFYGSNAALDNIGDELLKGIAPFLPRLTKLSIAFNQPNFDFLQPFLSLPGTNLPLLESFIFLDRTPDTESLDDKPCEDDLSFTLLRTAPKLRKAYISFRHPRSLDEPRFALPWFQLEHLYIDELISPSAVTHILPECTRLRSLCILQVDFRNDYGPDDPFIPTTPIVFPNLAVLKIAYTIRAFIVFDIVSLAPFFAMLCFPAAEVVQLASQPYGPPFPLYTVLPDLWDARGGLKHLKLTCFSAVHVDDLVPFLVRCEVLEELVICDVTDSSVMILMGLAAAIRNNYENDDGELGADETTPVLSRLQSFTFVCHPELDEGDDPAEIRFAFYNFVSSCTHQNSNSKPQPKPQPRRPLKYLALLTTGGMHSRTSEETGAELMKVKNMKEIRRLGAGEGGVEVEAGFVPFDAWFGSLGQGEMEAFPMGERTFVEGGFSRRVIW